MRRLRYDLEQCLPPLEMTDQLREFATAPTPPPALPIPFPQGLFSPLATPHSPPQEAFRFPDSFGNGQLTGKTLPCIKRRQLRVDQMLNNVILGVEERRVARAGRRGDQVDAIPNVPGVAPVVAAPPPAPTPVPAPLQPTSPTPAPTLTPAPVPPPEEMREKRQREECCPTQTCCRRPGR